MPVPLPGVDQNVRLVDSSGVAFGTMANPLNAQITGAGSGGTSAVDESAWTAGVSALTPGGGVFNDSAAALTSGQMGTLRMTPNRAQHVSIRTQAGAEVIPASFPVDAAAWTTAVSTFSPGGGVFNDTAAALTSGQQGTQRLTNNRAAHSNLRNAAGTELATAGAPLRIDPTGATTQPVTMQATAAAPGAVELSDGAAFYTAAKTGQLPAALVGGRVDVNVGKVPGTVSSVNSSTATLAGNAVFTGTSEDVSGYGLIDVSVFADQSSAAGGLSLQFSSNGTNWDVTQAVTITLNAGAAFTICPCAQFFRVVYTNGSVGQGAFRLQTVYHQQAAVPTLAALQDVNATLPPTTIVQRVAADLMVQDPGNNLTNRVRSALAMVGGVAGGSHLGQAAALYDVSSAKFYPVENTPSLTATTGLNLPGTGPLLWDLVGTTNFVKQAGDGSGRAMVVGAAASGAAVAGNPVLQGISDGTNAQTWQQTVSQNTSVSKVGYPGVGILCASGTSTTLNSPYAQAPVDGLAANTIALETSAIQYVWNATNFERVRSTNTAAATTGTGLAGVGPLYQAFAHGANPTAVTAGQYALPPANRAGIPFHIGGHPNIISVRATYSAAQTNTVVVANSAGTKLIVTGFMITVDNATTVNVLARIGLAASVTPTTTGVIGSHPGIAPGSGYGRGNGSGIIGVGADGDQILITAGAPTTGNIDVIVEYFSIAS